MNRFALIIAGLALGAMPFAGGVAAQESPSETIVNGGHSVADPDNPIVAAEGEVRTYGDIATGNSGGEVLGDAAALTNIQSHETIIASVPPPDFTPDEDPAPIMSGPAPAPADGTTTTAAPAGDGTVASGEPVPAGGEPAPTTTEAAPVTDGGTTAAPSFCDGYAGWYEAQVAYEAAGGVGGDPGLVQTVDADYDGVACEYLIVY